METGLWDAAEFKDLGGIDVNHEEIKNRLMFAMCPVEIDCAHSAVFAEPSLRWIYTC